MVMVRENTEGLYAAQENPSRSEGAERVVDQRVITKPLGVGHSLIGDLFIFDGDDIRGGRTAINDQAVFNIKLIF